ncbi:OmpA/MotB family protein [Desulfonatronovibrio hydrogenovorans]|uniref:OmpA/MotB family protein n=1 Tax=Desulfonatronovibrio hydrogenovorans TaxID=53245 RepID=UPI00048C87D2|nr:OmpA family protein [Desulfonatronovibrio hydrogenovorans]
MARKKKQRKPIEALWMVTFADMVTILLTFFILLLSMASLDREIIREVITVFQEDIAFISPRSAGRVPDRFLIFEDLLEKPWEILEKENRIKDLLFPDDVLPPEISKSTLQENLRVLARPEGIALMLTDELLFPFGQTTLNPAARQVLAQIVPLVMAWPSAVNIAGYTDDIPGIHKDNYEFAAERATAVMEYLIINGVPDERLSISAYGPHFPVASNETEQGRSQNRRVEILLKTKAGAYI